jgi:hypothetical protein
MHGTRIGELLGDDENSSSLFSSSSSLVLFRLYDLCFKGALPFLFLLHVDWDPEDCHRVVVVMAAAAAVGLRPRQSAGALDPDASPS